MADSVMAFYPLGTPLFGSGAHSERILDELIGIADAQGSSLLGHGQVVSGALSLGWWRHGGGVVISDGLVRARALQMELQAPVIVIDERLFAHVRAHSFARNYGAEVDPVNNLFRRFEGTLRGSEVSFCHLDYIRICLEAVDWADTPERIEAYRAAPVGVARRAIVEEGYRASVSEWLLAHAASIVLAHRRAEPDARESLEWLAAYHNAMVAMAMADPVCLCVLDPAPPNPHLIQTGRSHEGFCHRHVPIHWRVGCRKSARARP
ncbi:hypothetical protein [Luteibacter aegosomatissinici]|uniref:hypothetical protein n=1 Tax=Luteibacter aegosomatissinici TaxID=2911539 RepID=UPI001FF7D624|nr:hypothetical protein [Luteibacter aegosomatissinici]UPG92746.1 hypothetical protein L2Y97_12815 [Luteibacter aegosomatissinici]